MICTTSKIIVYSYLYWTYIFKHFILGTLLDTGDMVINKTDNDPDFIEGIVVRDYNRYIM